MLALGVVAVAAAPSSAGWAVTAAAGTTARSAVLTAVPRPSVASTCLANGELGVVVTWTPTDTHVTAYELWRTRDGMTTKVADAPPAATHANDATPYGLDIVYHVVSRASQWRAPSPTVELTGIPVCAPPPPTTPPGPGI